MLLSGSACCSGLLLHRAGCSFFLLYWFLTCITVWSSLSVVPVWPHAALGVVVPDRLNVEKEFPQRLNKVHYYCIFSITFYIFYIYIFFFLSVSFQLMKWIIPRLIGYYHVQAKTCNCMLILQTDLFTSNGILTLTSELFYCFYCTQKTNKLTHVML